MREPLLGLPALLGPFFCLGASLTEGPLRLRAHSRAGVECAKAGVRDQGPQPASLRDGEAYCIGIAYMDMLYRESKRADCAGSLY